MDRVFTAATGAVVPSAGFNDIQGNALGIAQMSGTWRAGARPPLLNRDGSNAVVIGATPGLILGTNVVLPARAPATLACGAGAAGLYFVYASNNSGAIGYELSATAPDAYNLCKAGDPTRAYVGPVYKVNSGALRPYRCHSGRVMLQLPEPILPPGSHSTTAAAADLSGAEFLPPNARRAILRATLTSTNDSARASFVVMDNGSNASNDEREVLACPADSGATSTECVAASTFEVCVSETRFFYWRTTADGGDTVSLDLVGWYED